MRWRYISPCHRIKAGNISRIGGCRAGSYSTYVIDWEEDRKNETCEWYEDYEECLEVSKEEVGVESTFADHLSIPVGEN
jgi:hypothetical protein